MEADKKNKVLELQKKLQQPGMGIPLLHLVMDYKSGDLAVGEVTQALYRFLPPEWRTHFTDVHSFKTTETCFVVGQYALTPRTKEDPALVLYVNCAPRKDERKSRRNNEGEDLVYGELHNGVKIVAVNSRYSLSLVRDHFKTLYRIDGVKGGSQFRSRDNFPPVACAVAQGIDLTPYFGDALDPLKVIPKFEEGFIGYIDSFGNIKTTYRSSNPKLQALKPGQEVEIAINGTEIVAYVGTGSFSVPEGNFSFSPGSSGWDDRFWEVFQRGHNAAQSFGFPQVGSEVKFTPLSSE